MTCGECDAALAHDQRYCVECGARRGPFRFAHDELPPGTPAADAPGAGGFVMPAPRAAAVAVMVLLAFGVVLGSAVAPTNSSEAAAPIVVAVTPPPPKPAPEPVGTEPLPEDDVVADAPELVAEPAAAAPAPEPARAPEPAPSPAPTPAPIATTPPIRHVFVIVLTGHGFEAAFGEDSKAPYLAKELTAKGELLSNYYAVAHGELANAIALVSGQGPNPDLAANCPQWSDVTPGTTSDDDPNHQVAGTGCVFPAATQTLGDQLIAFGHTWNGYVEDMAKSTTGEPQACRHPAVGSADPNQGPRPGDAYVTWRNPFVYFHSVIDSPVCETNVVDLDRLAPDLQDEETTPSVSYLVPSRCHDGSDQPCAPDQPAGLEAADEWLKTIVPRIIDSPAYGDGGMIVITFDQAPAEGPEADSTGCCENPAFPNMPPPPPPDPADPVAFETPGGGRVGLLLLSPYVKAGSVNTVNSFNHFSLLRSIEQLFGLEELGYSAQPTVPVFDRVVYNGDKPF
jgi:hypothetical protein